MSILGTARLVLALAIGIQLVAVMCACDEPAPNAIPPNDAARTFARDMNLPVDGVSCAGTDTDCDGYVTCTLAMKGDKPRLESVQCAALGAGGWCRTDRDYKRSPSATGCKLTVGKTVARE
jgi:hypothetical protein